jgi:hypothetical protein
LITDNRLFGLNKIQNISPPFLIEYKPQIPETGAECITSSSVSVATSSVLSEQDIPPANDNDFSLPCTRTLVVSNCGVDLDTGRYSCGNIYVIFLSTPCTEPPPGPVDPGGGPGGMPPAGGGAGGSPGGSSGGLPGLNITMPPCPVGMAQEDCDARSVPVMNYLGLSGQMWPTFGAPATVNPLCRTSFLFGCQQAIVLMCLPT